MKNTRFSSHNSTKRS